MNSELTKKALEKVGNANTLINIISRRVRQLTSGGGSISRPLILETANMGAADIALTEIIEEKIGWELLEPTHDTELSGKKRKRQPRA